jgi:hypothetical protein
MEPLSARTWARTIIGVIAAVLLVASFALVATLINRQQDAYGAALGCPPAGSHPTSTIVGAAFSISGQTVTYYFDSLEDRGPSNGEPGMYEYCVTASTSGLTNLTPQAVGDDFTAFGAATGSGVFSFSRGGGDPSNFPLNGATGIVIGTATWSGSVPTSQSLLLHSNDLTECTKLYGSGATATCWVVPSLGSTPTPTATATATPSETHDPTATPTIPQPTPAGTLPPGK